MKETDANKNILPEIPTVFREIFVNGFEIPEPETMSDQITGATNREFIARMLNWRDWVQMMNG